jgi:hypothetical protein
VAVQIDDAWHHVLTREVNRLRSRLRLHLAVAYRRDPAVGYFDVRARLRRFTGTVDQNGVRKKLRLSYEVGACEDGNRARDLEDRAHGGEL